MRRPSRSGAVSASTTIDSGSRVRHSMPWPAAGSFTCRRWPCLTVTSPPVSGATIVLGACGSQVVEQADSISGRRRKDETRTEGIGSVCLGQDDRGTRPVDRENLEEGDTHRCLGPVFCGVDHVARLVEIVARPVDGLLAGLDEGQRACRHHPNSRSGMVVRSETRARCEAQLGDAQLGFAIELRQMAEHSLLELDSRRDASVFRLLCQYRAARQQCRQEASCGRFHRSPYAATDRSDWRSASISLPSVRRKCASGASATMPFILKSASASSTSCWPSMMNLSSRKPSIMLLFSDWAMVGSCRS